MTLGIDLIFTNLNMTFETWAVLVFGIACITLAAKDFKLTLISWFIGYAGMFVVFYENNLNWYMPLTLMLFTFVLNLLIFIPVSNTSTTGGLV